MSDFDYKNVLNPVGQVDNHILREMFEDVKQHLISLSTGKVLQIVQGTTNTQTTTTSSSFTDSSLTVSITPSSTSNKVLVFCTCYVESTGGGTAYLTIKRASTDLGSANGLARITSAAGEEEDFNQTIHILDSPSTTSATTYTLRGKASSNTLRFGGVPSSVLAVIIAVEIEG